MLKRIKINQFIVLMAVMVIGFAACDRGVIYTDSQRVNSDGWNMNDKCYFDVDIDDTIGIYTFYIDLRVTPDYPYSNAFFFINTTFPDGRMACDTLEYPLADIDGRWYGRRTGRYIDSRSAFRSNMIFPEKGHYQFEVAHAMRDTNIVGIQNVGLRIARSER